MRLIEWTVEVPAVAAEPCAHVLREVSASGLAEAEAAPGRAAFRLYLNEADAPGLQSAARSRLAALPSFFPELQGAGEPFWREGQRLLSEEDWATRWRDHFRPVRVGRRLLVMPAWLPAPPAPGRVLVRLEPGLAFGTGQHASTRLALRLLLRALRPGDRVVDVGAGSGILAVAAALLGAARVFALDVDPVAVRVAAENAALNGVSEKVACFRGELADWPEAGGDVLLANISPEVVEALAPVATGRVRRGGRAVLAGFLADEADRVLAAWAGQGWLLRRRAEEEGWTGLLLTRVEGRRGCLARAAERGCAPRGRVG